ncbi:MAG TPA: CPBP family intramembrane metalloprotease, partial [bacterium]|nr:CPBP family intramembrane metalloprotease [bacterium]
RAPLILYFDGLSTEAWYGIGVSTLLFAVTHAFGEGRSNQSVGRRILHVVTRLPMGVMYGYFGVRSQTLWAPLALHIAWNAAVIVIVPIVTVLITIVIGLIRYMIEEVKYQFWKRRYLNGGKR